MGMSRSSEKMTMMMISMVTRERSTRLRMYFATEMTAALVNDRDFSAWLYQRTPAARWGKPEELIGAAVYLASPAAIFVNGHLLFVDGGMLAAV